MKELLQSPLPRLVTLLAEKARHSPEFDGSIELDESESALLQRISELSDGSFELAVVQRDDAIAIVAKSGIRPNDPLIDAVHALIGEDDVLNYFRLKMVDLESGQPCMIHEPSGMCFQYIDDELIFYSRQWLIPLVAEWKDGGLDKSLADSRKFQLVARRCTFSDVGERGAIAYVDVNSILDFVLKQTADPRQSKILAREVSFNELLAAGAVFEWGDEQSNEFIDFKARIHVSQGIPRSGINNVLRLHPLEKPIADDIPANVDISVSANIDAEAVLAGVRVLDTFLETNYRREDLATEALMNTLPLLGAFCYTISKDDVTDCKGLVEHFGSFHDTSSGRSFSGITRMEVGNMDANQLMEAVVEGELAAGTLVQTEMFGLECATWSQEFENKQRQQYARLEKLYPDLELPKPGRQIFFAQDGQVGLATNEELFEDVMLRRSSEVLVDNLGFRRCWNYASIDKKPGAVIYMSPGTIFRPIVYLNRYMINPAFHENNLELRNQKRRDPGSWQSTYHRDAIQSSRSWKYSSLTESLGPSVISLFETPNGLEIRIAQFVDSED